MLNVDATTGGRITASFTDTTAPGVATSAFDDGNGLNDKFAGRSRRVRLAGNSASGGALRVGSGTLKPASKTRPPRPTPPSLRWGRTSPPSLKRIECNCVRSTLSSSAASNPESGKSTVRSTTPRPHRRRFRLAGLRSFHDGKLRELDASKRIQLQRRRPTAAIYARRQLGDSPLSFFTSFRGSYLGGHTDSYGRSDGRIAVLLGAAGGAATVTPPTPSPSWIFLSIRSVFNWTCRCGCSL